MVPRRNKPKKETQIHRATIYDRRFIARCYGCAFAGKGFVCLTESGKCLKTVPTAKEDVYAAIK